MSLLNETNLSATDMTQDTTEFASTHLKYMTQTLQPFTGTSKSLPNPSENLKIPRPLLVVPSGKTQIGPGELILA